MRGELRYFGGLSEEEIANVLKISERTVRRDWGFCEVVAEARIEGGDARKGRSR